MTAADDGARETLADLLAWAGVWCGRPDHDVEVCTHCERHHRYVADYLATRGWRRPAADEAAVRAVAARVYPCARCGGPDVLGRTPGRNLDLTVCEVCAMKVESEYGTEAQRVAAVREVLADPEMAWWHTGGTRCVPLHALRAALAVDDGATETPS